MPEKIPGIFQYCNRWCKQCRFTERCEHFAYRIKGEIPESEEEFSAQIRGLFAAFDGVLREKQVPYEQLNTRNKISEHEDGEEHLLQLAMRYADAMFSFISALQQDNTMQHILQRRIDLGLDTVTDMQKEADLINNRFELLQWYMYLIPAKVNRALTSRATSTETGIQTDENGSAKVVLLAIAESLDVLEELNPYFEEDDLLDKQAMLSELRRKLETYFPHAYRFVRPGFDAHML